MLQIRVHIIMGHIHVSLWCRSHGPEHCLWSGRTALLEDGGLAVLHALVDALAYAERVAQHGEMVDLTDECAR